MLNKLEPEKGERVRVSERAEEAPRDKYQISVPDFSLATGVAAKGEKREEDSGRIPKRRKRHFLLFGLI